MLEEVSFRVHLTSQHPLQTIYSPTHSITVRHRGDREADIEFDQRQSFQVKDFQLFYATSNKEIGLTPLLYRPISMDDGYFLLTLSPQIEAAKAVRIPRDLVLVLDTSGSMSETKMDQAKKALRFCLNNLDDADRFGIVSFSTTAQTFRDELAPAKGEFLERARKWIDDLRAGGGTAIQPALDQALGFRGKDSSRSFTVVFFTDGIPTVDETNPDKIVNHVMAKNTANTRIFTFGVGDDVNAAMLDRLAEATRAVSTYVRPAEDIEVKVSGLHAKISYPVMTNVKLTANQVTLKEIYPPQLPDLFRGQQMIVMGRYSGNGPSAIRLTGMVGGVEKEIVYELTFPNRTDDGKKFVEDLWARRKVGYLLDQIRVNGESGELVQEIVRLAKRYGIATPYTSYLVVPDGPMPVIRGGRVTVPPGTPIPYGSGGGGGLGASAPPALGGGMGRGGSIGGFAGGLPGGAAGPGRVSDFAKREAEDKKGDVGESRKDVQGKLTDEELKKLPADQRNDAYAKALRAAKEQEAQNDLARQNYRNRNLGQNQQGKLGVDLAEDIHDNLRIGRIERTRGFVGKQIFWLHDERARQCDALRLATRQLPRQLVEFFF
jgi:Ca-activated chloride channel family protein